MNNAFYFIIILFVAGSVSVGYFSLLCLANTVIFLRSLFQMYVLVLIFICAFLCVVKHLRRLFGLTICI
jgi:hypothetical protein